MDLFYQSVCQKLAGNVSGKNVIDKIKGQVQ